jgi:Asp-tRNA(Asn)/Glu-tRNA(Gln) amidotransferase B subunit
MFDELKCPFHIACGDGCPWRIAKENGWLARQNTIDKIEIWVKKLLKEEPKVVEQIKSGKKVEKAKGHLVGKIMKDHPGASAEDVKQIIEKLIQKETV